MSNSDIKILSIKPRAIEIELVQPLETSSGLFKTWPLVLVDIHTSQGVVGHSFVNCFLRMLVKPLVHLLTDMSTILSGSSLSPIDLDRKLKSINRLIGTRGTLGTAVSMVEIAAWDALAKSKELPLACLLGSAPRALPVYKTIITMDPTKAAQMSHDAMKKGYGGVKCKLGHPDEENDLNLIHEIQQACGTKFPLMADYNQALDAPEVMRRIRKIDDMGLVWIEEPTDANDFAGHARIADSTNTPISMGENWRSPAEASQCLNMFGSDYAMPDLVNIGGISAWQQTAFLCELKGVPVSSHAYPETCAHIMAGCSNAHWLEHVDFFDNLFIKPLQPTNGTFCPSQDPGIGIGWNEHLISKCLIT